ncbi:M23 family metallopeptidase [Mariprofundus sp. EBB-1]|uniref:M23 family metallopeptidase n=1 Tax=Mariprofundus sp. EBB-1 TaxID=2650971 RepID=UPI000EF22180|nr:M23 family metallopeptidase [Mariprofundus sp. EBB-1]RLL50566.1 M23 family metallopeptidase [Mariprofundus sp. EBB-1]
MKTKLTLLLCAMLWLMPANASEWTVIQGNVASIEMDYAGDTLSLTCFGKKWPLKAKGNNHWQGWIGVDLKTKAGKHNVLWRSGKTVVAEDFLNVTKGEFRISHITVAKKMAEFDKPTLERYYREVKVLKATYTKQVSANPDIIMFGKPIEGIESTPFGAQRYVNGKPKSPHSGIDIAAPAGTVIEAPLAGRILMVADMYLNGKTVAIGHGNGLVSVFSHMQSTAVKQGEWVKTRQKIGEVGTTGRSTGPHLHWGIRFNNARINPESIVNVQ